MLVAAVKLMLVPAQSPTCPGLSAHFCLVPRQLHHSCAFAPCCTMLLNNCSTVKHPSRKISAVKTVKGLVNRIAALWLSVAAVLAPLWNESCQDCFTTTMKTSLLGFSSRAVATRFHLDSKGCTVSIQTTFNEFVSPEITSISNCFWGREVTWQILSKQN